MKAVVLAGGRGRRLHPYTMVFPKPLAPVGEVPILEIVLRQLAAAGFHEITLTLGYLGELIEAYLAARSQVAAGLDLRTVTEPAPTGTAGSLTGVPGLDETFLVMNGDVLTSLDFRALVDHHRACGATLTIACHRKHLPLGVGVLELAEGDGRVIGYREKPDLTFPVSMGVYVYEPEALDYIPRGAPFDLPELVERLLEAGRPVASYTSDCVWLDIGEPADFARAGEVLEAHREELGLA